jgi:hypothetical protein
MKIVKTFAVAVLSLFILQANAQTEAPKGFKKGSIVLADGTKQEGFIKDNIRKNASVVFSANDTKKDYQGSDLNSVEIEGVKYISLKGDFFKLISEGELNFLQKASDASGKLTYNGSEAIVNAGTEGKINDYFIYNSKTNDLKWVSKKNITEVAEASFAGSTAAIDKAKAVNEVAELKEAVDIYNSRNK